MLQSIIRTWELGRKVSVCDGMQCQDLKAMIYNSQYNAKISKLWEMAKEQLQMSALIKTWKQKLKILRTHV